LALLDAITGERALSSFAARLTLNGEVASLFASLVFYYYFLEFECKIYEILCFLTTLLLKLIAAGVERPSVEDVLV